VWLQKISIPLPQRVTGNSEGEGILKAKIFKECMSLNWNFQRGGGFKPKRWEYGYLVEKYTRLIVGPKKVQRHRT